MDRRFRCPNSNPVFSRAWCSHYSKVLIRLDVQLICSHAHTLMKMRLRSDIQSRYPVSSAQTIALAIRPWKISTWHCLLAYCTQMKINGKCSWRKWTQYASHANAAVLLLVLKDMLEHALWSWEKDVSHILFNFAHVGWYYPLYPRRSLSLFTRSTRSARPCIFTQQRRTARKSINNIHCNPISQNGMYVDQPPSSAFEIFAGERNKGDTFICWFALDGIECTDESQVQNQKRHFWKCAFTKRDHWTR